MICLLAQIHIATFNEEMSLLDHQIYVCLVFRGTYIDRFEVGGSLQSLLASLVSTKQ